MHTIFVFIHIVQYKEDWLCGSRGAIRCCHTTFTFGKERKQAARLRFAGICNFKACSLRKRPFGGIHVHYTASNRSTKLYCGLFTFL